MNSKEELKRPHGRPRSDADQRRNDIISGGRDVFIEAGYINTTINVVAARCGISKKTFCEFFDGKADLLRQILRSRSDFISFIPADDVELLVMRRVVVPFRIRFDRLHEVLQVAFGWTNSHLYEFRIRDVGFGIPDGGFDEFIEALVHRSLFNGLEVGLLDPNQSDPSHAVQT